MSATRGQHPHVDHGPAAQRPVPAQRADDRHHGQHRRQVQLPELREQQARRVPREELGAGPVRHRREGAGPLRDVGGIGARGAEDRLGEAGLLVDLVGVEIPDAHRAERGQRRRDEPRVAPQAPAVAQPADDQDRPEDQNRRDLHQPGERERRSPRPAPSSRRRSARSRRSRARRRPRRSASACPRAACGRSRRRSARPPAETPRRDRPARRAAERPSR